MNSITLHNLEPELARQIQKKAAASGASLNKTIKGLLRDSLGMSKTKKKHNFDKFFGVWSKKEAQEFERIIEEEFEVVDKKDWK